MMPASLFVAFALMTALAVMAVLWPLGRRRALRDENAADLAVYRDQLAELERDQAAGRLPLDQAEAARIELSRRMLAVADSAPGAIEGAEPGAAEDRALPRARIRRRVAACIALVGVPLAAIVLYATLGTPELPGAPLAARLAAPPDRTDVAILVRKVEDHLAANPRDGQGYEILAPVYLRLGRVDDAVRAYAHAIQYLGDTSERRASLGEALVMQANGVVTKDAAAAFQAALALDPSSPRALYFLGLAAEQDGRKDEAASIWTKLLQESPPNAPWIGLLRTALERIGAPVPPPPSAVPPVSVLRRDPASGAAAVPPGPNAQDVEAAAQLDAAGRAQMIEGMVDRLQQRLDADPKDLDGWLRLARARMVLGEREKAQAALAAARTAFAGDDAAQARIAAAAKELKIGPEARD
ncbi:c-type cytochrome biogenesis protein CcmI [Xanthobacter sp. DSM 24535]|uniref:c-type cytochrome biogenesis protein CcmI n=1 Tax=Roseixanthobacter psychrophilus TaxID=3119917 RepID=UPI00372AFA9F